MAEIVEYHEYHIAIADPAKYQFAIASTGGTVLACPVTAAAMFSIPFPPISLDLDTTPDYISGGGDYTIRWGNSPIAILHNNVDSIFVASVASPGVPPIYPAGPDLVMKWLGVITNHVMPGQGDAPPLSTIPAIPPRRWINGFEIGITNGEGGSGLSEICNRDASRTFDGMGLALRGSNVNSISIVRQNDEYIPAFTPNASWERFYLRKRVNPNTTVNIWECHGQPSSVACDRIKILPTGQLGFYAVTSTGVESTLGLHSVLVPFQWHKIDLIITTSISGGNGVLRVYFDGALLATYIQSVGITGLGQLTSHTSSRLCDGNSGELLIQADIDDWISADIPVDSLGFEDLHSIDWLGGSHVKKYNILTGVVSGLTPNALQLANQAHSSSVGTGTLDGNTPSASVTGVTDVTNVPDNAGISIGLAAGVIVSSATSQDNSAGQIGYSIAAAAYVLTTVNEFNFLQNKTILYRPSGMPSPTDIVPFGIKHVKSASGANSSVHALQAVLENIGLWGPEDDTAYPADFPRFSQLHNCRYPNTEYTAPFGVPLSNTMVVGGIYTGNGTEQHITLPVPCHFLMIRSTVLSTPPVWWMGASLGGHLGGKIGVAENGPIRVWADDLGQVKFTVAGIHPSVNQNGTGYQYIAFCDPGMRYSLCGAFRNPISVLPQAVPLQSASFTPQAAFMQGEEANSGSGTQTFSYKGPGHPGNHATNLGGVDIPLWGSFGTGVLNTLTDLNAGTQGTSQNTYILWKGVDACAQLMFQFVTYTGDGVNPRTVSLTPLSGRFPIFAMVIPRGVDVAHFRDPSHVGTSSTNAVSGAPTAEITGGGIDFLNVSSTLNQVGAIYDVFVICGDTAGWNNGMFYPANCLPPEDGWPLPEIPPLPEIAIMGEGGLVLDGQPPSTLLLDISGIYTLVPDLHHDTLIDRQTLQPSVDVEIPDPTFKTGYIGG